MTAGDERWRKLSVCVFATLLALAGCNDQSPGGQVLASVGGDDITKRDLATEAATTGKPPSRAMLNGIVDRKLLVSVAKRHHLDLSPDYLSAVRRFREAMLASLAVREKTTSFAAPTDIEIRTYAADHPWMFAGRERLDVVANGVRTRVDTASIRDSRDAKALLTARPGQTVHVKGGVVTILAQTAIPMGAKEIADAVRSNILEQNGASAVTTLLSAERQRVRVRYQNGFGPAS